MAVVYDVLISLAVASFVPLYFVLQAPTFWVVLVPAVLLLRSSTLLIRGGWRDPRRTEAGAVLGFFGMLLIPVALTVAFVGAAVLGR
jgi:hypothetical protein